MKDLDAKLETVNALHRETLEAMTDSCPFCNVSFQGELIPEKYRGCFEGRTHFSRVCKIYNEGSIIAY